MSVTLRCHNSHSKWGCDLFILILILSNIDLCHVPSSAADGVTCSYKVWCSATIVYSMQWVEV